MADARLPYATIDESFLAPRDPLIGYVKIGGKEDRVRYTKAGKPWVAPVRFVEPARFEITTREKRVDKVPGKKGTKVERETFTVDLGYRRDEELHKKLGPKPDRLRVRLLYPRWGQNLISFLGAYSGSSWVCRGNGVEATDTKRGEVPCPCPRLKQFEGTYEGPPPDDGLARGALYPCKPHGQLNVLLDDADVFGAFWAFKTTSFETISNLTKSLQTLERIFGRLDGLPLELRVMQATKSYGEGTTTQPIVTIVLAASMDTARQVAADAAAESRKYLPADRTLDEETYRAAIVSEMEEEAASYAGEYLPAPELEAELVEDEEEEDLEESEAESAPRDDRPSAGVDEPTTDGAQEHPEGAVPPPSDSDRNDDEPDEPEEGPDDEASVLEETCGKVLTAAGWEEGAIAGRLEYHRKSRTLEELAERLQRSEPDAWASVVEPGFFDGEEEPEDGLGA